MFDLSKVIKTRDNAARVLSAMDDLVQKTYTEGFTPNEESLGNLYPLFKNCSLSEIRDKVVEYRDQVEKMNTVSLQISSMPSKEFTTRLHEIIEKEGLNNFLINISVEKDLGYSCQLSVNGKYLKSDLESLVLNSLMSKNVI